MISDTLLNGLKDLFYALGAKTTDSNYAVPLLNKTSGQPQGMMDISSLASVLGVQRIYNTEVNANAYVTIPNSSKGGIIIVTTSASNGCASVVVPRQVVINKRQLEDLTSISIERTTATGNVRVYSSSYTALCVTFISF